MERILQRLMCLVLVSDCASSCPVRACGCGSTCSCLVPCRLCVGAVDGEHFTDRERTHQGAFSCGCKWDNKCIPSEFKNSGSTVYLDDSGARLDALFNSRLERGVGEEGGTKTLSTRTLCQVGRSIEENSPTRLRSCRIIYYWRREVWKWKCRVGTSRWAVSETVVVAQKCGK